MELNALLTYLDDVLQVSQFKDYCPNGLQIAGKAEINTLVTGVSACLALLEAGQQADAILVHHGYFWRGENPCIVGSKRKRLQLLLAHDINLLAYHLPLDAHPEWGNNAQLGKQLGLQQEGYIPTADYANLICYGKVPHDADSFATHIEKQLGRTPLHIPGTKKSIQRIAWCTGAAQNYIDDAIAFGADAYLTGEASEQTVHAAREAGIHFFGAGHHATERYAVAALGDHLAEKFGITHRYIEIDNPV